MQTSAKPSWPLSLRRRGRKFRPPCRAPKYKQLKRVLVTSNISRNTMGKIQKKDLRKTYKGTFASR
jgi:hypothetical protein